MPRPHTPDVRLPRCSHGCASLLCYICPRGAGAALTVACRLTTWRYNYLTRLVNPSRRKSKEENPLEQRTGYRQSGENRLYDRPSAKGGHTLCHLLVLPLHHQVLLNTQGARTDTLMCTVYCVLCSVYTVQLWLGGSQRGRGRITSLAVPCFDAASHPALRNSHVHSPIPCYRFCFLLRGNSTITFALSCLSACPVPRCPGCPAAQVHRPAAAHVRGQHYSTALVYRRFCPAVVVQWACWTDCKHVSHLHGTQTCPLMPSVW